MRETVDLIDVTERLRAVLGDLEEMAAAGTSRSRQGIASALCHLQFGIDRLDELRVGELVRL